MHEEIPYKIVIYQNKIEVLYNFFTMRTPVCSDTDSFNLNSNT